MEIIEQSELDPVVIAASASPMSGISSRLRGRITAVFSSDGLKARVLRGGVWMGAGSFSEQVSRFARNMILTRLLAPEAFGTMAVVLSAGSVIQMITDIGVKEAIIQNPRGSEEEYLSVSWWLAALRAVSIYLCIFLMAPLISRFYGNHELVPLLRVVALGVILEGTLSSKAYVAVKNMKFKKWALINHGGGISGVIITLILSLVIRDVWALVIGNVAETGMKWIFSYVICPYLPSFTWDRQAAKELLHFSRGIFGLSFLNLIFSRTDVFVLAKLFSPAQLGFYVMGIYLVQTPAGFLTNLLGQTLLPTLSKVQGDSRRENRILLQVSSLLVQLGMPGMVFMFLCGRALLTLFYGTPYAAAAVPLMLASCVALMNVLNAQITTVFYGRGVPQLHRRAVLIMAILMIVLVYPFAKWFGLPGGQLACLLAVLAGYIFQVIRLHHLTSMSIAEYVRPFLSGMVLSTVVLAIWLAGRGALRLSTPAPSILLGAFGCLLAYALCAVVFFRKGQSVTA